MNTPPVIYIAHPITGEFGGTGFPDPDPLDAGNWLVPAHAFLDAPPVVPVGEVAVRGEAGWSVVVDRRGTVYSTKTGEAVEHAALGELPAGLTIHSRPSPAWSWSGEGWTLCEVLAAEIEQAQRNSDALAYLSQTDWYVIRKQETGEAIPVEVLDKRQAARKAVVR